MSKISYPCRTCGQNTLHEVVDFDTSGETRNTATLECTHCDTPKFAVYYAKESVPDTMSRRVPVIIIEEDPQPSDLFE